MWQDDESLQLLDALRGLSDFHDLWDVFRTHMNDRFGFGTGFYGVLVLPNAEEGRFLPQMHSHSDFPEDYIAHVQQERPLWEADPILPHCLTTGEAVSWRSLQPKTLEHEYGRELLMLNHDLGLRNGYSVPMQGVSKKSMIGLHAPDTTDREFDLLLGNHGSQIEEAFQALHHTLENGEGCYSGIVGLSPRERECLLWSAAGLSSKRIAHRLNLSDRTVENSLFRAQRKLKATNKSHAVYKAVVLGLIAP